MRISWVASFALGIVLTSCSAGKGTDSPSSGALRIFYNNDNFAYLETCGCRVSPIGGMDRRWNAMQVYPKETRLFLDAGNLLFKSTTATEFLAPQWFEQAIGVVEAYNVLGADAATPGATDFALGLDKFLELKSKAKFTYISSNLVEKKNGKLFLPDSIVVEKMGKKIGIFALFHPSLPLPPELEAKNPLEIAPQMVKALRARGADMVVVLSHQGYSEDESLARKVKGIDLIVGAHSQSLLQKEDWEGETLLVQLSNQGQLLGMVEYPSNGFPKKVSRFIVDELDTAYDRSPGDVANPMKALVAVTNLRMTEANKKMEEKIWAERSEAQSGYQTFLSCRECHGKQAKFQETHPHSAAYLTLVVKKQERNLDCVKCHSVGLNEKGGFRHMQEAFFDADGKPLALNKVMEGAPAFHGKYRDHPELAKGDVDLWLKHLEAKKVKKTFVGVQCENCHGPRAGHPFDTNAKASKVLASACIKCHTKEQMPSWYSGAGSLMESKVEAAIRKISCPAEK